MCGDVRAAGGGGEVEGQGDWGGGRDGREWESVGESVHDEGSASRRPRGGPRRGRGRAPGPPRRGAAARKPCARATQTRRQRDAGRRQCGGGGPTRWGERGAAVGRCAGQWTGVRGLGRRWGGTHLVRPWKSIAPRARRLCTSSQGREGWGESRGRAGFDGGCAWAGVRQDAGRARGWQGWRRTHCASRSGRSLAADAGRRRQRAGAGTAAARAVGQGGRVGTPAGALTCENIQREAKRDLFGQGGKGARKAGGKGLRGLCEAEGIACGGETTHR